MTTSYEEIKDFAYELAERVCFMKGSKTKTIGYKNHSGRLSC